MSQIPAKKPRVDGAHPTGSTWFQAGWLIILGALSFGVVLWLNRGSGEPRDVSLPLNQRLAKSIVSEPGTAPTGMVWIPGGEFVMGTNSANAWPDEKPAHRVAVDGFWMDATEITNSQFTNFVQETGYVTTAERAPNVAEILANSPPGTPPPAQESLVAGSLVFTPPQSKVPLDDVRRWWTWTPGANWRQPEGPASDLRGREAHPVVHVSWDDAVAYAQWAGKQLPTEAQWECAARGGLQEQPYIWGSDPPDEKRPVANLWTGSFPHHNNAADGFARTAPVATYPPNGFGLHDMAGNVWEWCSDWYDRELYLEHAQASLTTNPAGPEQSRNALRPFMSQRAQRGGSFLCNDDYCSRYKPSSRHGCTPDTGMSHVGFRCVKRNLPAANRDDSSSK